MVAYTEAIQKWGSMRSEHERHSERPYFLQADFWPTSKSRGHVLHPPRRHQKNSIQVLPGIADETN